MSGSYFNFPNSDKLRSAIGSEGGVLERLQEKVSSNANEKEEKLFEKDEGIALLFEDVPGESRFVARRAQEDFNLENLQTQKVVSHHVRPHLLVPSCPHNLIVNQNARAAARS